MIAFTVVDYWKYYSSFPVNSKVNDTTSKYKFEKTHQYHDKIFKTILDDKKEFISFIKKYLEGKEFDNLKEEDVEKYSRQFISANMKVKEADIIYKIAKRNVFIIIEHQTKIDYDMPRRMTQYCMEIIDSVERKSNVKYPLIYPIVLYTGKGKWNAPLTLTDVQEGYNNVPPLNYPKYNLVDINDYSKEYFKQEDTGISKAFLFEKLHIEEVKETIEILLKKGLSNQETKYIKKILRYSNVINTELPSIRDKYLELLDEKGGENGMIEFEIGFVEYVKGEMAKGREMGIKEGRELGIKQGRELGIKQGKELGIKQGKELGIKQGKELGIKQGEKTGNKQAVLRIAREMLRNQMKDELIISMTKITPKELEKIKNEELENVK